MRLAPSRRNFLATPAIALHAAQVRKLSAAAVTARLRELIPELLRQTAVPGLSVALIEDAQLVWAQGFGVRSVESKAPVDAGTVFEAASLSKPAFAYAALKLVDEGKLNLDAPLSGYLPQPYIANEPRLTRITARMVLSHTSGLPHGRSSGTPIALRFDPGARFAYSSTGIEYLKSVVLHSTKRPFPEWMKASLLDPFQMSRSSFGWSEQHRSNLAEGHSRSGRIGLTGNGEYLEATPEEKQQRAREYPEFSYPSASAGLYTTAPDYARFLAAILQPHPDRSPLSAKLTAEMVKPQVRITGAISWGLGWGLQRTSAGEAFWHWGDWGVFRNFCVAFPKSRSGVVVFTNSFHGPKAYQKVIAHVTGVNHPAFPWVDGYRP